MTKLRTHMLFTFAPARLCIIVLFCFAAVIAAPAQSVFFTTLVSFDGANGGDAYSSLIQATDGNFYGTTYAGGTMGNGTVFKVTAAGTLTTLHSFDGGDGAYPQAEVVQGSDENLYGTTVGGGAEHGGVVFKITPTGTLTTLYNFCSQPNCTDGYNPRAGLVQGSDGNFYGTTFLGGADNNCPMWQGNGCGTVFKITPAGTLTTLYSFCAQPNCTDGSYPFAGLVQGSDGNFYGTAQYGGNLGCGSRGYGCGTVFKITPSGTLTTLHTFAGPDGAQPYAGLVQGRDGYLYGTTPGGANGYGTVFKISSVGTLTTLYKFCSQPNCTDGSYPETALVQANDGNFYGTTGGGGAYDWGTVFKITPTGALTTLYGFCSQPNCADGAQPFAGLVQGRDGNFYGTTTEGGTDGLGTVFRLGVVRSCVTCRP